MHNAMQLLLTLLFISYQIDLFLGKHKSNMPWLELNGLFSQVVDTVGDAIDFILKKECTWKMKIALDL